MLPSKPLSQTSQFTLSRLSSAVSICCLALASAVAQAAGCDYLPDQPADAQISQCQSSSEAAVGEARSSVAKAAFDAGFRLETAKPPKLELSARYYQIAADLGSPGAQFNLANQIVRSGGDMSEAANYYRMAAKQGAKLAQYNLATQYLTGQGIDKDPQKAYLWFRTAAGLGLAAAQFELASLFERGLGVEKNTPSAIGWYELAAEQGYAPAQQRLDNLKKNLTIEAESEKGLFGGLLIPRAPRQTLGFDPNDYFISEFESEVAAQTSDFEADKTGSLGVTGEEEAAGFLSGLFKPKNRSNPRQFVYSDPESSDAVSSDAVSSKLRSSDALSSAQTLGTRPSTNQTPAADLAASEQPPSETKEPSESLAGVAPPLEPAEPASIEASPPEIQAETEVTVVAQTAEQLKTEAVNFEEGNLQSEEAAAEYQDITQETLPESVASPSDPAVIVSEETTTQITEASDTAIVAQAAEEPEVKGEKVPTDETVGEVAIATQELPEQTPVLSEPALITSDESTTKNQESSETLGSASIANEQFEVEVEAFTESEQEAEEVIAQSELPEPLQSTAELSAENPPSAGTEVEAVEQPTPEQNIEQTESVLATAVSAANPTDQDLSTDQNLKDVPPAELPAAEILTSALPAADLPETTLTNSETLSSAEAQSSIEFPLTQARGNLALAEPKLTQSSNPPNLNSEQLTQKTATPMAIEAAPEQILAANAQSPEELEKILQDLPSYQVERPEFPAERAYLRAAESGSEMAQLALANAYAQGKGVPADSEVAAKWYLRAARQGNADASLNLALSYKLGNGLKKNNEQALKWFKHSAFRGNPQALYNLGAMHASGIGTDINEILAARYFSQSANLGYEPAKNALAFLNR